MTSSPLPLPLRKAAAWCTKSCDVCGETTPILRLNLRRYELATRRHRVEMLLDDVICERCGFLFAGKVPDTDFISEFYRDAHTSRSDFREIKPDFDIEARLVTLRAHLAAGITILEIGANDGTFTESLRCAGFQAIGLDPLETAQKEFVVNAFAADGAGTVPAPESLHRRYGAVLAYYVLEHVTDARTWLAEIRDYLQPGGVVVIEVPNFDTHPVESLYPEHFLHLTPVHLSRLLAAAGFEVIECGSARPSRYFGFTAVARRVEIAGPPAVITPGQAMQAVIHTKQRYRDALDSITQEEARMTRLAAHLLAEIGKTGEPPHIYIWAVNIHSTRIARALTEQCPGLDLTAVDSAVSKIGTLHEGFAKPVQGPHFDVSQTGRSLFILCSPNWNPDIRNQIEALGFENPMIVDGIRWPAAS